jgi:hypothetical protein
LAGAGLFVIWRLYIQPEVVGFADPYVSGLTFAPVVLIQRILVGLPVFAESWVRPFEDILPNVTPLKLELILAAECALMALIFRAVVSRDQDNLPSATERFGRAHWIGLFTLFGTGLALWAVGLVPAVGISQPFLNFHGASTRIHSYAILGGAIWLAVLIALGVMLLAPSRRSAPLMMIAAVVPLLVNGVFQQIWIQNEARLAWRQQQTFWKMAFITLPDLVDGTTVLVAMRGDYPTRPFEKLPLSAEWEVNHGFKVLYNNPNLQGMLFFTDFTTGAQSETRIMRDGVKGYVLKFVPYNQMVIVTYNPSNQSMQVVADPVRELDLPFAVEGYDPMRWILPDPPSQTPYRRLMH